MIIALFLWGGGQLIEVGDELAFEYKNNRDGFFKVLLCKNLTKDWVAEYDLGRGIIILKIVGWSIFLFFVLVIVLTAAVATKSDMIVLLSYLCVICCWVASIFYSRYSTKKKIKEKFIKRHNL